MWRAAHGASLYRRDLAKINQSLHHTLTIHFRFPEFMLLFQNSIRFADAFFFYFSYQFLISFPSFSSVFHGFKYEMYKNSENKQEGKTETHGIKK